MDNPLIESTNTSTLDITRVELTDTSTVLYVDACFVPGFWIRIDSDSYIQSGGEKYKMTGTHGIQADSLFWMPESGEASFILDFEPLPKRTKSFDFIESDCEDCFKLFGIDLTGKKEYARPKGIPAEALKDDGDIPVPAPVFKSGQTVINVHLIGYRKELMKSVDIFVNTIFNEQQEYSAAIDPATGTARIEFPQFGTAQAFMTNAGNFWIAPGETIDVYCDLRCTGYNLVRRRAEKTGAEKVPELQGLYTTGTYACLNSVFSKNSRSPVLACNMNLYDGTFADWNMSAEEYSAHVVSRYETLADSIARCQAPSLMKDLQLIRLKQDAVTAIVGGDFFREHNYRCTYEIWDPDQKIAYIDPMKAENMKDLFEMIDTDDPSILMGKSILDYIRSISGMTPEQIEATGTGEGLANGLRRFCRTVTMIQDDKASDSDIEELESLDNPFFAEAARMMLDDARAKLAETETSMKQTPDVPVEKLFESIIAPHRGKVILVDFWNTWCGPCRAALEMNEPLKETELKSDDMVWIYIANETSPVVKYKTMIQKIKGLHYRLDERQWDYITGEKMFDIDGIPSYVLVDRSGNYKLRNDLRDHNLIVKTLKEMLND